MDVLLTKYDSSEHVSTLLRKLATHLPDLVIQTDHRKEFPHQTTFEGVLLFVDVSGFTALCERYSMNAKNGTDQLTRTLNAYMGSLVDGILKSAGDVIKFAGDAILAVWKTRIKGEYRDTLTKVIRCCLEIQKNCGEYVTDVGVKLRVKMGISVGEMTITFVGNNLFRHYVATGKAVDDVNKAEKFCESGYVVLSPDAWENSNKYALECEIMDDNKHRRVVHMTEFDASVLDYAIAASVEAQQVSQPVRKRCVSAGCAIPDDEEDERYDLLRVASINAKRLGLSLEESLRPYVPRPVLKKLDDDQPEEYLSEMRQVSIVFINLVLEGVMDKHEQGQMLKETFDVVFADIKQMQGCLNKIFMFDKGCTFLAIFGLPGYKHERDCAHALECSYRMKQDLNKLDSIKQTSIGVTTGLTFCGVVGHKNRHEYTVIGRKVNMAARLMMYYPGKVTCDNDTYHHSKLTKKNFIELAHKEMKGLKNVGIIREFKQARRDTADQVQQFEYPLLGRDKEMELFARELEKIINQPADAPDDSAEQRQVIVIEGEAGYGKTRVLDAMIGYALSENFSVISCAVTMNEATTPFYVVRNYMLLLLELDFESSHQEREHKLVEIFRDDTEIINNLCLLNDLLVLKFPMAESFLHMDAGTRSVVLHDLLYRMVHQVCEKKGFVIFAADDAQFIDPESWNFVGDLGHDKNSLVLLSMRPFTESRPGCEQANEVLNKTFTYTIPLRGINKQFMSGLACQILDVCRIPKEIETILAERSHGVPSWCEQLLREMYFTEKIIVVENDGQHDDVTVAPDQRFLMKKAIKKPESGKKQNRNRRGSNSSEIEDLTSSSFMSTVFVSPLEKIQKFLMELDQKSVTTNICIVAPGVNLKTFRVPDSMKGMLIARIDRMNPSDQMFLKVASILGVSFSRGMLESIIPNSSPKKVRASIRRLAQSGVIECAHAHPITSHANEQTNEHRNVTAKVVCQCPTDDESKSSSISSCKLLRFRTLLMQETAYELFLESQRQDLHIKAALFLENQAHKCKTCGGGNFIYSSPAPGGTVTEKKKSQSKERAELTKDKSEQSIQGPIVGEGPPGGPSGRSAMTRRTIQKRRQSISAEGGTGGGQQRQSLSQGASRFGAMRSSVASRGFDTTFKSERSGSITASQLVEVLPMKNARRSIVSFNGEESQARKSIANYLGEDSLLDKLRSKFNKGATEEEDYGIMGVEDEEGVAKSPKDAIRGLLGLKTEGDVESSSSLDTFSEVDLRECECMEILASVYPQLVRHWKAGHNIEKSIHFLVEAGAAALATNNNMQALSYLEDVSHMFEEIRNNTNPLTGKQMEDDEFERDNQEEARVESLLGQALFHMGRMDEAVPHFNRALKILGNSQPSTVLGVHVKIMTEGLKQYMHRKYPDDNIGSANPFKSNVLVEQARCLSHVFHEYCASHDKLKALAAALQQVNRVESANSDPHESIIAYICMMECCLMYHWSDLGVMYEKLALGKCADVMMGNFTLDDLISVAHVYSTSLEMRLCQGRIEDAIESGYAADAITERIHDNEMELHFLPLLAQALLLGNHTDQFVNIMDQLKYTATEMGDVVGQAWYYAGCLDLMLEAGIPVVKFDECLVFVKQAMTDPTFSGNTLPKFYLAASLALWYARINKWNTSDYWFAIATENEPTENDNYKAIHGFAKICECRLLVIANSKHLFEPKLTLQASKSLKKFHKLVKMFPVFKPRLLHLQAYLCAIKGQAVKSQVLLQECLDVGDKMGDILEMQWSTHSFEVWFDPLHNKLQDDFWQKHADGHDMDWHASSDIAGNIMKFSLPLPKWIKNS